MTDIRLIACDMDGTLLDSQKRLPKRWDAALARLTQRGIHFVVSSGRQYYNLVTAMGGREEGAAYISDNGSIIFEHGRCIHCDELEPDRIREAVAAVRSIPGAHPILCGVHSAYYEGGNDLMRRHARMYYERLDEVPDVLAVLGQDPICKVAVFDERGAEDNSYPRLRPMGETYQVTLSGDLWVDLANPCASKGAALQLIQQRYGVPPEACMAFGDYLNDSSMMAVCRYGFAMANAHPDLKAICPYVTAYTNDEDGVLRTLDEWIP